MLKQELVKPVSYGEVIEEEKKKHEEAELPEGHTYVDVDVDGKPVNSSGKLIEVPMQQSQPEAITANEPELPEGHSYVPEDKANKILGTDIEEKEDLNWAQEAYLKVKPLLDPAIEMGLGAGGAILGGISGGTVGSVVPFAGTAAGIATGGAAGGTLGYAAGEAATRSLEAFFGFGDDKNLGDIALQTAKDLRTGATLSLAGEAIAPGAGKAIGAAGRLIKSTAKGARDITHTVTPGLRQKIVKEKLGYIFDQAKMKGSKAALKADAKMAKIVEEVTGVNVPMSGRIQSEDVAVLERSLLRNMQSYKTPAGKQFIPREKLMDLQKFNDNKLKGYMSRELIEKGNLNNYAKTVQKSANEAAKRLKASSDKAMQKIGQVNSEYEQYQMGNQIYDRLETIRKDAHSVVTKLYDEIPSFEISQGTQKKMVEEIDTFVNNIDLTVETLPKELEKVIKGMAKKADDGKTMLKNLTNNRRLIGGMEDDATMGVAPNRNTAHRLGQLRKIVDEALEKEAIDFQSEGAIQLYNKAKAAQRAYSVRFREDAVGELFTRGARGERSKLANAAMANKFMTPDGIKSLEKAIAQPMAGDDVIWNSLGKAIHWKAAQKAFDAGSNTISKKHILKFMNENKHIMTPKIKAKLGNVIKVAEDVDIDKAALDNFNKGIAASFLKETPEHAMASVFKGSSDIKTTAKSLMATAGKDENAIAGMQSGFTNFLKSRASVRADDFIGKSQIAADKFYAAYQDYLPAIKEIYKNDPKKLTALKTTAEAFKRMSRAASLPSSSTSIAMATEQGAFTDILTVGFGMKVKSFYMANTVLNYFLSFGKNAANRFATEALVNPNAAQAMINLAKTKTPKQFKEWAKMYEHIVKTSIRETGRRTE